MSIDPICDAVLFGVAANVPVGRGLHTRDDWTQRRGHDGGSTVPAVDVEQLFGAGVARAHTALRRGVEPKGSKHRRRWLPTLPPHDVTLQHVQQLKILL